MKFDKPLKHEFDDQLEDHNQLSKQLNDQLFARLIDQFEDQLYNQLSEQLCYRLLDQAHDEFWETITK